MRSVSPVAGDNPSLSTETQNQAAIHATFFRAFLPFWITTSISVVIFCTEYHRRHAPLTVLQMHVSVGGQEPEEGFTVKADGEAINLGNPVTLGRKTIVISTPYTKPVVLKHFVWYGPNQLGSFDLERTPVSFHLEVHPKPDQIELHSSFRNVTNATGSFALEPAGRYEATFRYGELTDVQVLRITSNIGSRTALKAAVGAIELSSDPADAKFQLVAARDNTFWSGAFPAAIPRVRAGDYGIVAERGDYRRELSLTVRPDETNRVLVKFIYGATEIITDPPGASVFLGGTEVGRTPLTVTNLVPKQHQLVLSRDGYDTQSLDLRVDENSVAKVNAKLVNTRYRQSVADGRAAADAHRYRDAIKYFEVALAAQPNDAEVMELLPRTKLAALREQAEDLAQRGEFAAATDAVDQSDRLDPNSTITTALREKIARLKTQTELQRAQDNARQAVQNARQAAAEHRFQRALTQISEAKQWAPDLAGLPDAEKEILEAKTRWEIEEAERERSDEILRRRQELEATFVRTLAGDRAPGAFDTGMWQTSKSLEQVRTAIDTITHSGKDLKISGEIKPNGYLFALKLVC